MKKLLRRFATRALKRFDIRSPGFDPRAILGHERSQRALHSRTVRERSKSFHGKLDARYVHSRGLFDFGVRDPGGAKQMALAVHDLPHGGDAMAGGISRCVGIVKIRDLLVPVLGTDARRSGRDTKGC